MVSRYAVLKPRVVLRPFRGVVRVTGGQMGWLRRAAQRMIRVMKPATACGGAVVPWDGQRRGAVLDGGWTMAGRPGVGQRSRAAHLARRLPVDVGEAFSESGAAMGQEPNTAGSRARRPKF